MPSYVAFIKKSEAERVGFDLNNVSSPYELWNSKLPKTAYVVFGATDAEQIEKVQQLTTNPEFVKKELWCGN